MHYSINIQGQAPNGSFTWNKGIYRFKNPYITMMKVLFNPLEAAFNNVDSQNIVTNGKDESVVFDKGFYTLAEIISMLNEMTYSGFSISNATYSFGCINISTNTTIDFSKAPDICEILGLTKTTYLAGSYYGENIIDITRNRQVIQVYSSIVRTSDLKIANQNNNLLTTMILNDPQVNYLNTIEDVSIPICNRFDKLYFSFKDLDGNLMKLNGLFELQLTIDDVIDTEKDGSKIANLSQFSITQVCNTPKTIVKLSNPLSFKQCYISAISLYTDFQLYNIPEDQVVIIDGNVTDHASIEIPKGTYDIEELIALLNTGDALFELIYEGENAFKVSANYFYRLDFTNAPIVQKILGFEKTIIQKGTEVIKRFFLPTTANKLVVTNGTTSQTLTIPSAYYTFEEFYTAVSNELTKVNRVVSIQINTGYIQYICAESGWYFDRSSRNTTIGNYGWTPWFKLNSSLKNLCIELPDTSMNGTNGYAFLPESYMLLDNLLSNNESYYLIKPKITYTMTEDSKTLCNGTITLENGDFTNTSLMKETVDQLNSAYQQAKGLSDSEATSIAFTASGHIWRAASFAPALTLSITADNHTSEFQTVNTNTSGTIALYSKDVEYGDSIPIYGDIHITVQFKGDAYVNSFTIPSGKYTKINLVKTIVDNINKRALDLSSATYVTYKIQNNRYVILCRNNTNPDVITTCSDVLFPIPNGTWRNFTFKYIEARCIKMPTLCTPLEFFSKVRDEIKPDLFNTVTEEVGRKNLLLKRNHKIYFVNPTTLAKVTPSFIGNFLTDFIYYNNGVARDTVFRFYFYYMTKTISSENTLTYKNSAGQSKTITLLKNNFTQEEFIQDMNEKFAANDIPLEWLYTSDGYMIKSDDPFTLTCSLLNDKFLGPSNPVSGTVSHIWKIPFNQLIQLDNTEALYSDNPIDITNGLSSLKLYCNIVKSKTKPLLSNITIEDLYKNYYYKNRILIPCTEQLDQLTYEFRNENDEELSFLGNIYLLLTFTIKEK